MERVKIIETLKNINKEVRLLGRAETIRDHGKVTFIDIADDSGLIQTVTRDSSQVSPQDVIELIGVIKKRPPKLVNSEILTGEIEMDIKSINIISHSETPPIPVEGDGLDIDEDLRLKYRYLDLRRPRLQKNLRLRHQIVKLIREFLDNQNFTEIETPYLSKTTPEGARDFLVPSRLHKGKSYALAQAPQQYKQLLMLSNFEKYYQIARAFRDEDMRADRQFEHTQIDIEMAFTNQEEILNLVETMMIYVSDNLKRKIFKKPFPQFTYKEAMKKYNNDRFDLRVDKNDDSLAFAWITDFPLLEFNKEENRLTFTHNPFTSPKEEDIEKLKKHQDLENIIANQFDLVLNGEELGSGSIRITDPSLQKEVFRVMGFSDKKIAEDFGHILDAYKYGAPPHGGIALGLDRICAMFTGEKSIREVIAFPMSGSGITSVMDAPSEIDDKTLKELKLKKA